MFALEWQWFSFSGFNGWRFVCKYTLWKVRTHMGFLLQSSIHILVDDWPRFVVIESSFVMYFKLFDILVTMILLLQLVGWVFVWVSVDWVSVISWFNYSDDFTVWWLILILNVGSGSSLKINETCPKSYDVL